MKNSEKLVGQREAHNISPVLNSIHLLHLDVHIHIVNLSNLFGQFQCLWSPVGNNYVMSWCFSTSIVERLKVTLSSAIMMLALLIQIFSLHQVCG